MPGDFFGEMSILDCRPRNASVMAETPSTFLTLAAKDFRAVLEQEPRIAGRILEVMAGRLRDRERSPLG